MQEKLENIFLTTSNGAFLSSGYFLMGEWRVKVFFFTSSQNFLQKTLRNGLQFKADQFFFRYNLCAYM